VTLQHVGPELPAVRLIACWLRLQQGTPRSSGEGAIPVITLLSQLATALSALAFRAAGCRVATLCHGTEQKVFAVQQLRQLSGVQETGPVVSDRGRPWARDGRGSAKNWSVRSEPTDRLTLHSWRNESLAKKLDEGLKHREKLLAQHAAENRAVRTRTEETYSKRVAELNKDDGGVSAGS
jgi:hypothetical protein